jgi:hypothetical protein
MNKIYPLDHVARHVRRFADAEKINPFQVLIDFNDHAVGRSPDPARHDVLTELALAAAVVAWWTRWQPMMIHCALRAGASLADIAEATGLDADEVVRRWERWTEVQTQMDIGGRPAVTPVEVRTIRNRIGLGVGQ